MKSLGIPNSKYFQDISTIADAFARKLESLTIVAEKLKSQTKEEAITADVIEEFEDEYGNVFNKKTYEGIIY